MAESERNHPAATSWPIHAVDAPEYPIWNWQEQPPDSLLDYSVQVANNPSELTEIGSVWDLPSVEDFQIIGTTTADLNSSSLSALEEPYSPNRGDTYDVASTNRFTCSHCSKPFSSQKDVDRHQSSIHDRSKPYFCHEPGCRRSREGFTRKDNYEKHVRNVHGKPHENIYPVKTQSKVGLAGGTEEEDDFENCSREKLVQMLMKERENCAIEQRRRREVEEELKKLRKRYEEREDAWLKFLMTKGGSA